MLQRSVEVAAAALASAAAYVLYSNTKDIVAARSLMSHNEKYQAGEDYGDAKVWIPVFLA